MNQYCLLVLDRIYRVSQETNCLNFSMSKFSYDSIGLVGSLSLQGLLRLYSWGCMLGMHVFGFQGSFGAWENQP